MTLIEKIMLILAVLMPIVALIMFLPKIIKSKISKKPKKEKPSKQQTKPDEPYTSASIPQDTAQTVSPTQNNFSSMKHADDFKDYATRKSKRTSLPKRNYPSPTFSDFEGFRSFAKPATQQEKSVADEIKSLSPQLKALILSGALDRKEFDE